ncbi:probable E3 ubiquitin-protein ligase BAH1-like [Andrographis paniculata]|uniref:probable E3 ubiquitin-protein ligase BAH1-like n=1 Tax=Andrographis paniculata TaxID=175694 RepID=UPI0021E831C2|nr:probable E3 ubiquitin-protein ligase BAH1-like [Andrographis paniculata]
MKFGETFTEYLETNQGKLMEKLCNVEYKRLKKVLKSCRCRATDDPSKDDGREEEDFSLCCRCETCPSCDETFFTELMKEASDITGCFSARVRHLLQLHVQSKVRRHFILMRCCFASAQQPRTQDCKLLIEYAMMNAVAMRKILKKYDKVHSSVNGMKFKSRMLSEHMEILHTPWLIELGAFAMNSKEQNGENSDEMLNPFSFDLTTDPKMTLILPDSMKLEYSLTCAICLELVFNPYALGCGHLFCKGCACSAASVMIFEGIKAASPESKCPVCREAGVYNNAVHMMELDLLLKKECKEYWKERLVADRAETLKQSKIYWNMQAQYMIGY